MRVAVTGVSGFIGSYVARRLTADGHKVTGLVRSTSRTDHLGDSVDRIVVGDHADPACWPKLLAEADAVVHNSLDRAAPDERLDDYLQRNLVASIRLLTESAPRRFVYISSVAAVSQILPRWDGLITDDHPTRPSSRYGAMKAAVESFVWAEHLGRRRPVSIVRPSAVYGVAPDLSRSHGYDIIRTLRATRNYNTPGGGKFVHVEDVAAVVARCCTRERADGGVFNLADCYARWGDWAAIAADVMGLRDAVIDLTSPAQPRNRFDKSAVQALGVAMDRGTAGIRRHLEELLRHMAEDPRSGGRG